MHFYPRKPIWNCRGKGLSLRGKGSGFNCIIFCLIGIAYGLGNVLGDVDILYRKEVCDEAEFYVPYVRLLRTRQPHHESVPILKLYTPGYLSVTRHSGILCINGPAIIYTDLVNVQCPPSKVSEEVPGSGEPQIFNHECFSINRLPKDQYKKASQKEIQKDTPVFGNKVFGVFLLGAPPDYRLATFQFFPRPDFGFRPESAWCLNSGASLAFVANSSDTGVHCYSVPKHQTDGVITANYPGTSVFCYRADQEAEFDSVFHKEMPVTAEEMVWRKGNAQCDPNAHSPGSAMEFEIEPLQLPDFRMIHPKFWSSQGSSGVLVKKRRTQGELDEVSVFSRPNPPGSHFAGEPGWNDATDTQNVENFEKLGATQAPHQKHQVDLSETDCDEVPTVPEEDACNENVEGSCDFLYHVLTLEETDWKSEELQRGSWRLTILNLVTSIYEKACPQISRFLSSALSRVFQYILSRSLKEDSSLGGKFNGGPHQDWSELTKDLEKCDEKALMMSFFKKKDAPAMKLKTKLENKLDKLYKIIANRIETVSKQLQSKSGGGIGPQQDDDDDSAPDALTGSTIGLDKDPKHLQDLAEIDKVQNHLNELPIKFPYTILVGNPRKPGVAGAAKIFQYREAAEVDHELDWALDAFWKVITTVMGYCYVHFSTKDAATFDKLYQAFAKDFMLYVDKEWIKGDNLPIYQQLFGEFIYGSGALWLDACQNGAYQWSDIVDLRPVRPLHISEGDAPPPHADPVSSPQTPSNFFLDNPSFDNEDHYDYYDDKGSDVDEGPDSPPTQYKTAESLRKNDEDRKVAIAEAVANIHEEDNKLPGLL